MREVSLSHRDRSDGGFTLLELIVVVLIVGVLAVVAIPVFLSARESGYLAAIRSDLRNASLAAEGFAAHHGSYAGLDEGALAANGFRASDAVVISVDPGTDAYSITATNAVLSSTRSWTYSSVTGAVTE